MSELRKVLWVTAMMLLCAQLASAQESDILVSKSGPDQVTAGADVTFTIDVSNGGPDASASVTLDDPLPAGLTFVSLTPSAGPGLSCSTPAVGSGGTVSCTFTPMAAAQTQSFSLVVNVPPATPPGTFFVNIANVSSATFDPNDENNAGIAVVVTSGLSQADLGVSKTGPGSSPPDSDVTYVIGVTNGGPDAATNVSLQDTLPGTMTFVSLTQTSGPALSCTPPAVGSGGTITCTAASFAAGSSATLTLTGHIPAGTSGSTFQNIVTVASDSDPNDENNQASTALLVSSADLSVTKSGPPTATAGGTITYTLTIANSGPDAAVDAQLTDPLPPGTTYVSIVQDNGPPASCLPPPAGTNGTVTCTIGVLASTASAQFTLVVNAGSAVSATNTATASTSSSDTNPSNDSASVTTTVSQVADLSVNKLGPSGVVAGSNITYTVTVSNSGPSTASSVLLTDAVPAGTTFVSATQTAGPPFSCPPPSAGTITCTGAALAPGASATFSFVVSVPPTATAAISNTADVSSAATSDPNPGNNSSTVVTAVSIAPTDLAIVKTANPGIYATGLDASYTITVTNLGLANANGTEVTDTLPGGTTLVSATPSQGTCSGTTTVTCNLGTLSPSGAATITLTITLPSTPGPLSNTASVTTTSGDTNPANDSSTATITVLDASQVPAFSSLTLLLMALAIAATGVWLQRGT